MLVSFYVEFYHFVTVAKRKFMYLFSGISMIGLTLFVMGVFEVFKWLNKEGKRNIKKKLNCTYIYP